MYFLALRTLNNVSCSVLTYYINYSEGEPGSHVLSFGIFLEM